MHSSWKCTIRKFIYHNAFQISLIMLYHSIWQCHYFFFFVSALWKIQDNHYWEQQQEQQTPGQAGRGRGVMLQQDVTLLPHGPPAQVLSWGRHHSCLQRSSEGPQETNMPNSSQNVLGSKRSSLRDKNRSREQRLENLPSYQQISGLIQITQCAELASSGLVAAQPSFISSNSCSIWSISSPWSQHRYDIYDR